MIDARNKPVVVLLGIFLLFWTGFAFQRVYNHMYHSRGDLAGIMERGTLRVCGENDLFGYYSDEKGYHGFHYELAKAYAEQIGVKLEYFSEPNFQRRLKILSSGRCDIIAGQLPVITELKSQLNYTEPLYVSRLMLVQRKTSGTAKPVRNQVHLSENPIYVPLGSPFISRLHNLADEISDSINIREIPVIDNEQLFAMVSGGFCVFAVCDEQVAHAFRNQFRRIDTETPLSFSQFYAWAVKKGNNALLESLNGFISNNKKSPAFVRLSKEYLVNN